MNIENKTVLVTGSTAWVADRTIMEHRSLNTAPLRPMWNGANINLPGDDVSTTRATKELQFRHLGQRHHCLYPSIRITMPWMLQLATLEVFKLIGSVKQMDIPDARRPPFRPSKADVTGRSSHSAKRGRDQFLHQV
jgi:hypothetical protein